MTLAMAISGADCAARPGSVVVRFFSSMLAQLAPQAGKKPP
jgi:hypothetical protein